MLNDGKTRKAYSSDPLLLLWLKYIPVSLKDYDSIVKLVEALEKLPTFDLAMHDHVKFHYAFALNR